jgi:hypothetical protein
VSNLLDLCTANSTTPLGPCAEVRVGEHVTRYVRRGSGPSVVVVGANVQATPALAPLVERLAASHRVVVPQPPPAGVDVSIWLRGFIEGIGLSSIVLIAGGDASAAAVDLATTDDFTVRCLILLPTHSNGAGPSPVDSRGLSNAVTGRTLPLLPEWTPAETITQVEDFIR